VSNEEAPPTVVPDEINACRQFQQGFVVHHPLSMNDDMTGGIDHYEQRVKRVKAEVKVGEQSIGYFNQYNVFLSRDSAMVQPGKGDVFDHAHSSKE